MQQTTYEYRRARTHYLIVPGFVKNVVSLNDTAITLRRKLVDCRPLLERVDREMETTNFADRWREHCKEYRRILGASEAAAIKVAVAIRCYVSIQEKASLNLRSETDSSTTQELSRFKETLSLLTVDQRDGFDRLRMLLEIFEGELEASFLSQTHLVRGEYESAQRAVVEMEEMENEVGTLNKYKGQGTIFQPISQRIRQCWATAQNTLHSYMASNDTTHATVSDRRSRDSERVTTEGRNIVGLPFRDQQRIDEPNEQFVMARKRQLEAEAALDDLERNQRDILDALQNIQAGLQTQSDLLQTVLSEITSKLAKQSNDYLEALRHVPAASSPTEQLASRNARHRFLSTSEAWRERATTLTDEYAKRVK